MRCISVLLSAAAVLAAQPTFITGQAARAVIGQVNFTSADPNSSGTVIGAAAGIAYAANTLFVADDNRFGALPVNHRVLLFQNLSQMLPAPTAELTYNSLCPVCVGQASVVLGQPDFSTTTENIAANQYNLRLPTAVASDGIHLVVADTNHNRILIWNQIPTANDAPADVVVGQPNFTSSAVPANTQPPSATTMSGPQGVWIQNGKLYVADTQYNRVLIWNHIPTANGAPADVVVGQPNMTTFVQSNLNLQTTSASASNMINPVSVTSDGTHLFVTDLGYNRVLIWNHIPTTNGEPADVEVGQPDMVSSVPNNAFTGSAATSSTDSTDKETPVLCNNQVGKDPYGNPTYPSYCEKTLSFPRFALSDGTRLFIADGGNDRVLEYLQIPTANALAADVILGQQGGTIDQASNAVDDMNTPSSLAWDGTNLYVADPYNRRITVYTVAANNLQYQAVRNSASLNITASGSFTIALTSGDTIHAGDVLTVIISLTDSSGNTINTASYTYKVQATDALTDIVNAIVHAINTTTAGGDPNVLASPNLSADQVVLTAKVAGPNGNNVTYSTSLSSGATITATIAGDNLTGGGGAANIAPGTLVSIIGSNLSAAPAAGVSADPTQSQLPTTLAGTQVYFNGIPSPLLFVSPTQINAQIPWEFNNTTSVNAYIRSVMSDGSIMVTSPAAVTIVPANPGIFAQPGTVTTTVNGPFKAGVAVATHASSYATDIVSVDGTADPGDTGTVTIGNDRSYTYTVQTGDTLDTVRDAIVALINTDPDVTAQAADVFDRVVIQARVPGPDANGIPVTVSVNAGANLVLTAFESALCCANVKGAPITQDNPAVAGEIIDVYATGIGLPVLTDVNRGYIVTGVRFPVSGPETEPPDTTTYFVSSLAGGSTADVLKATLLPGMVGVYLVELHLNDTLPANSATQLTIAQSIYVSSPVTIPVVVPGQ
jgi:uncharacterized protein (TIGR03437 family)